MISPSFAILLACSLAVFGLVLWLAFFRSQGQSRPEDTGNALALARKEAAEAARSLREELSARLDALRAQISVDSKYGREEAATNFNDLKRTVEQRLINLQTDNNIKLDEMRMTVAEKLEGTLERRLGDSFKLVSERLEMVHKGLGEMQSLAVGVGDLKKVMVNVKTRGIWGEVQLGNLLEQILTPEQFSANVQTKPGSAARVEFAIKMPGRETRADSCVWLPIDAKFPLECYQRLVEAQEQADAPAAEIASRQLESFIRASAKDIAEKYLSPPDTTDFGVMFLPTEGLFAEVARRVGIVDQIQRDHRVIIAGPTTLGALLNSLQMGFRSLAIQKRSSEVWEVLAAVKGEFGKFEDILTKVQKKLQEAGNVIDTVHSRSRVINRKLSKVQEVPGADAMAGLLRGAEADQTDLDT